MASKAKKQNARNAALDRLLRSLATQALTLTLLQAPKKDRYLAFAALCEQAAEECYLLADEADA
jgi:hypothetical protein